MHYCLAATGVTEILAREISIDSSTHVPRSLSSSVIIIAVKKRNPSRLWISLGQRGNRLVSYISVGICDGSHLSDGVDRFITPSFSGAYGVAVIIRLGI